jgi:hypothetical protein
MVRVFIAPSSKKVSITHPPHIAEAKWMEVSSMFHEVEPVELRARCAPRLHKMIKAAADESARSMSAEITYRLRKSFDLEEARQTKSAS